MAFEGDETTGILAHLLQTVRFELLPLEGAEARADSLPQGAEVAVTADPALGMSPTIELSVALAARGFRVIPHLSAQLTRDAADLHRQIDSLAGAGIERALVVGGVADEPGPYRDGLDLMRAIEELGSPLRELGIAGYPEGHHVIPDHALDAALAAKAPGAAWVTTQICFDTARLESWLGEQRARGIEIPIWLGIPAVADVTGLMSLGLSVGAGRSLQFMFEHPRLVMSLARPGGRRATRLVRSLADLAADPTLGVAGFHLFTYNQIGAAERWRRRLLTRLGG